MKQLIKDLIEESLEEFEKYQETFVYKPPQGAIRIKQSTEVKDRNNQIAKEEKEQENDRIKIRKIRPPFTPTSAIGDEDEKVWFMVMDFFGDVVSKNEIYKKIIEELEKLLPGRVQLKRMPLIIDAANPKASLIQGLICNIFFKKSYGKLNNDVIEEYIETFIEEISTDLVNIVKFSFLSNVQLEVDSIELEKGVVLKKDPSKEIKSLESFGHFFEKTEFYKPFNAIIIDKKINNPNQINPIVDLVLVTLQLFRLSDVSVYMQFQYNKTSYGRSQLSNSFIQRPRRLFTRYTITSKDVEQLIQLYKELSNHLQITQGNEEFRNIMVALQRYDLALYGNFNLDQRMMFAVMGLESILSTENERSAHALRLSLRITKFLSFFKFPIETTRKNILHAFNFRNKVVHGLDYDSDWIKSASILFPKILNYLRILIVFRLLNLDITKKDFVKLLDNSLLIESQNEKLKKITTECYDGFNSIFKGKNPIYANSKLNDLGKKSDKEIKKSKNKTQ